MSSIAADLRRLSPTAQCFVLALLCWPIPVMAIFDDVGIGAWPLTVRGAPVMVDFANFWVGAEAAWGGDYARLFVRDQHVAHGAHMLGAIKGTFVWSYPPPMMLLALPFAAVSNYLVAILLWLGLGVGLYGAALRFGQGEPIPRRTLAMIGAAILFMPGTFHCLAFGQTSLLTGAALLFGLHLAPSRPIVAGAILALLVCKPHLGIMVPAALIGLGAWRAFVATPVFAALYVGLSVAVFGPEPWQLFVSTTLPQQLEFLTLDTISTALRISPYYLFLATGVGARAALLLHGLVAVTVMGMVIAILRRERDRDLQFLTVALATLLASPYLQAYELPLAALAIGRVAMRSKAVAALGSGAMLVLAAGASLGTLATCTLLSRTGYNLTPACILALLVWLNWSHLRGTLSEVKSAIGMTPERTAMH